MEQTLIDVADQLAREFCERDQSVVIRALCDCLRTDPGVSRGRYDAPPTIGMCACGPSAHGDYRLTGWKGTDICPFRAAPMLGLLMIPECLAWNRWRGC